MKVIKLHIENFKGVKHKKIIDFSESLTILRGPNGFGKTTIFDVIELCLTGTIKRAAEKAKVTNDTKDYGDAFYRNIPNRDVVLKLLVENISGERRTIVKYLPFDHDGNFDGNNARSKKFKVIDSLEKLPTYFVSEEEFYNEHFYEIHNPLTTDGAEIQEWLFGRSNLNIRDIYKLFGYIQQDENTLYLDLSETKRRDELDFLYNSQDQAKDIEDLGKNLEQLRKAEEAIKSELTSLDSSQKTTPKNATEYKRLFTYLEVELDDVDPFAKDGPKSVDTSYAAALDYLNKVKVFTERFDIDVYNQNQDKQRLRSLISNKNFLDFFILRDLLEDDRFTAIIEKHKLFTFVSSGFGVQYYVMQNFLGDSVFSKLEASAKAYVAARNYIDKELTAVEVRLSEILNISNNNLVTEEQRNVGKELNLQLLQAKKATSQSTSMLVTLSDLRSRLVAVFEGSHPHESKDSECPLCGHDWKDYEELRDSIKNKTDAYEKIKGAQADEMEKLIKRIETDFINIVERNLNNYVEKHKRGYALFEKISSLRRGIDKDDFKLFSRQIEEIYPKAKEYIWSEIKSSQELSSAEESLRAGIAPEITYDPKIISRLIELKGLQFEKGIDLIRDRLAEVFAWEAVGSYERLTNDSEKLGQKLLEIASKIEIDEEKLGGVDANFFKDVFMEKADNIDAVTLNIDSKIEYIGFKYRQKKNELYGLLNERYEKIKKVKSKITTLRRDYKEVVTEYKNTMTDAIKIPFHIYSARILQNYSQGLGAFIDTPSQSSSAIRFSAGSGSDHDLVHQLSSGQLAVVSMAFSLAINKVYGTASLSFIAIDDPVHELDILNIYSLIELLREDFADKYQLILSTHDDLHADYIAYRFASVDKNVLSLKVQDAFFPTRLKIADE